MRLCAHVCVCACGIRVRVCACVCVSACGIRVRVCACACVCKMKVVFSVNCFGKQ